MIIISEYDIIIITNSGSTVKPEFPNVLIEIKALHIPAVHICGKETWSPSVFGLFSFLIKSKSQGKTTFYNMIMF